MEGSDEHQPSRAHRQPDRRARAGYAALLLTPVSLVLGKLVGLYNRDATVIDKSTQELPRGRRCVEPSGSRSEWKARTDFMVMW
jgi:hypothetical protein